MPTPAKGSAAAFWKPAMRFHPGNFRVERATTPEEIAQAAEILFPDDQIAQTEALVAGERSCWLVINSANHLSAPENSPLGAALVMSGDDQTCLVWPPCFPPQTNEGFSDDQSIQMQAHLLMAIEDCLQSMLPERPLYAQALCAPEEWDRWSQLATIGFQHIGQLDFMGKKLEPAQPSVRLKSLNPDNSPQVSLLNPLSLSAPSHREEPAERTAWDVRWFSEERELLSPDFMAQVIDATLVGSLDLPCLEGVRNGAQILAGQRQLPRFSHQLSCVAFMKTEPVAVALICADESRSTLEVAYLGVVAGQRGHNYGQRLLETIEEQAASGGLQWAVLAVDSANTFAKSLYVRLSYVSLFPREIFLWRPTASEGSN